LKSGVNSDFKSDRYISRTFSYVLAFSV